MRQYIVDAFTSQVFAGNPAAVCVMDSWIDEDIMKKIAAENNLSETVFIVREGEEYRLRWFTPGTEVDICGHATLASAFVVLNFYDIGKEQVTFNTKSGLLTVMRKGNRYEMDFPTYPLREIPVTDAMADAFGVRPLKAILGLDLICLFDSEQTVRSLTPNQSLLRQIPGRIQNATAPGITADCVSRSFCPKLSIPEDPVCGSAHCQIADYWSQVLEKQDIHAFQASSRGGTLHIHLTSDRRVLISGEAALFATSELNI